MAGKGREFEWWAASAQWLRPCAACGIRGYVPETPDESGYDGDPNPGGAAAAAFVKGAFEPLVEVGGTHFCQQCAPFASSQLP